MDYQILMEFIKPELLVLVVILYIIGIFLKRSQMNDKKIPIVLGSFGITMALLWVFSTTILRTPQDYFYAIFSGITQGILCAGCSVYVNQIFKQSKK